MLVYDIYIQCNWEYLLNIWIIIWVLLSTAGENHRIVDLVPLSNHFAQTHGWFLSLPTMAFPDHPSPKSLTPTFLLSDSAANLLTHDRGNRSMNVSPQKPLPTIDLSMFAHIVNTLCPSVDVQGPVLYLELVLPFVFCGLLWPSTRGYNTIRLVSTPFSNLLFSVRSLVYHMNILKFPSWNNFFHQSLISPRNTALSPVFIKLSKEVLCLLSPLTYFWFIPDLVYFGFYLEYDFANSPLTSYFKNLVGYLVVLVLFFSLWPLFFPQAVSFLCFVTLVFFHSLWPLLLNLLWLTPSGKVVITPGFWSSGFTRYWVLTMS